MSDPLISVAMSVYNAEDTVREAVESIFAQTYPRWELVICDDGSTDGTREVLQQLIKEHPEYRITLLINEHNRGIPFSANRCLKAARGQLIARMDADDISEPGRFQKQIEFLEEHPEIDLVGTSMRRFNSRGIGVVVPPGELHPDRTSLARTSAVPFCHATILARREVFDHVGGYTVAWRTQRGEDLDLWYKFYAAGFRGDNLAEPLYRVREDEAAVRRRSPRSRLGIFTTRVVGNWRLRYPPRAYAVAATELAKMLVPYRVVGWNQRRVTERSMRTAER